MSTNWKTRFRPTLDHLEARELPSANPVTAPVLPSGTALVQQATNRMQVNHGAVLSDAADSLAARQVTIQNGVADITQVARATRARSSLTVPFLSTT
jgi:hypothetical protein